MRRREFITLIGGAAAAWPLAAHGQSDKIPRIGFIGASLEQAFMAAQYGSFLAELREQGFEEGRNIVVEYKRNDDPHGPFAAAAELMRSQADLIVATGPEATLQAVIGASRSIPIIFLAVQYDPIARGYVKSLAHPGGNVTGIFYRQLELAAKQLELLVQTFPERSRLGVLYDAASADQFDAAEASAKSMPLQLRPLKLEKPPYDFGAAFQTVANGDAQMVLVLSSPFLSNTIKRLRLPRSSTACPPCSFSRRTW
jgi:putative tryptophan/tyrosine transport system substrate-binding protein